MYWWEPDEAERFFMEITTRDDIGVDLKAPRDARNGKLTPGYALIEAIRPGDAVIHYSSREEAIVGVSRVVGRGEPHPIYWVARGSYARRANAKAAVLPGIRVPLVDFTPLAPRITLAAARELEAPIMSIRDSLQERHGGPLYFPWTPYRGGPMRTFQSYLVKFPKDLMSIFPSIRQALTDLPASSEIRLDSSTGIASTIEDLAGKSRRRAAGQGFQLDQEVRVVVEARAMDAAISYFSCFGTVEDVHGTESFDLTCKMDGILKHIEVKGTTTDGDHVLLTPLEVAHARDYPHVALFILANIEVTTSNEGVVSARGGTQTVFDPWHIDDGGNLIPLGYTYLVPASQARVLEQPITTIE
jgi:hypothetical protein